MEIKNSKTKTIFGLFFAIIFSMITIFAFIPSTKQNIIITKEISQVLTDEVIGNDYSFNGSDVVIPYMEYWHKMSSNNVNVADMMMIRFLMNYESIDGNKVPYIEPFGSLYALNSAYSTWSPCSKIGFSRVQPSSTSTTIYERFNPINHKFFNYDNFNGLVYSSTAISNGDFIYLMCNNEWRGSTSLQYYWKANVALSWSDEYAPEFNIQSVIIGSTAWNGSSCTNYIQYNSANGYWFKISFYTFDSYGTRFETRTYYLTQNTDSFNTGYNSGYTEGYNSGVIEGSTTGYDSGYSYGYSNGYNVGHAEGVNDSNVYSFTGLISAVIDAPIKALLGLFDFTIFGINFRSFALAILTFSIILVIVRLLLKGGKS